jgi:hypothetical protein
MRPERLAKEIKRRVKVLEVFSDECSVNEDRMGPTMSFLIKFYTINETVC